ncbi:MAG: hypothetical protein KDI69_00215 [Xanthomonadales bacterium]|nr:hypothetical protein [Xanthomonadales bacterium]
MAKQRGRLEWLGHMEAAARSGLSKAAYCREHRLVYKTFLRWVRQLEQSASDVPRELSLVPLAVSAPTAGDASSLRLQVGDSVVLVVPRSIDARWLGELMRTFAC